MDGTLSVACFLRNRGEILLRRDDGAWRTVSETTPADSGEERLAVARRLAADVTTDPTLVRAGDPVEADDGVVAPFLFDCDDRPEGRWVSPPDARDLDAVPWLWPAYLAVAPTVRDVAREPEYGSAYLSVRALAVLRDSAARGASWADLDALAGELVDAQPGMAVLENRVNRVMSDAGRDLGAVVRAAKAEIPRALDADAEAAAAATDLVAGRDVFTVSRSGTVLAALERADPSSVVVTRSATDDEGLSAAEVVSEHTPTTVTIDAAAAHALAERSVDCVLVGADAILPTGGVVNKVGTRAAALAANHEGVPVYVVAASDKLAPSGEYRQQHRPDAAVYDGERAVDVFNPVFDVTPPTHVDRVVTERGRLTTDEVAELAGEFAAAADWRRADGA